MALRSKIQYQVGMNIQQTSVVPYLTSKRSIRTRYYFFNRTSKRSRSNLFWFIKFNRHRFIYSVRNKHWY
jgi:hypothetical protein